jgi:hypothetical protein
MSVIQMRYEGFGHFWEQKRASSWFNVHSFTSVETHTNDSSHAYDFSTTCFLVILCD